MKPIFHFSCLILQASLLVAQHSGSSPFDPPKATDTLFVVDTWPGPHGLDTGCTARSRSPLKFAIKIDRVVGDVDSQGFLKDVQTLVNNGVVSKTATLKMPAYDVDFDTPIQVPGTKQERDRVVVNGKNIGENGAAAYLTGSNNIWKLNEFQVPIEYLKFPPLPPGYPGNLSSSGTAPTAVENEIQIFIDEANTGWPTDLWCTGIDWATLTFKALAPVIMIHGNNSSGQFWNQNVGFSPFVQPFKDQKILYDNSISMITDSTANHGALLASLIPGIAIQFGSKHVHLVAHSKGGLDTREFLAFDRPDNFGVYSLTTLSTPHHGSAGADYYLNALNVDIGSTDDKDIQGRIELAHHLDPDFGLFDLTTTATGLFNLVNLPFLPTSTTVDDITDAVAYRSFSAEADLNGNGLIELNEIVGIQPEKTGFARYFTLVGAMNAFHELLGKVATVRLAVKSTPQGAVLYLIEVPTPSFQMNDLLVTITSARIDPFTEIYSSRDNHDTVANADLGSRTIKSIQSIQPVK